MVVEGEGVQKIIRRIKMKMQTSKMEYGTSAHANNHDYSEMLDDMRDIADDFARIFNLILAETGHWHPYIINEAISLLQEEMMLNEESTQVLTDVYEFIGRIMGSNQICTGQNEYNWEQLEELVQRVSFLVTEYITHTELPI